MQVSGHFSLQVIGDDDSLKASINQNNLVLNGLWNYINDRDFPSSFNIQLGTGNSEPNVNDVTLNEFLYQSTDVSRQEISGVDQGNTVCLRFYTEIPAGKISKSTVILREIGLSRYSSGPLVTRALINSEDGGQLVEPTDVVKITYDLRFTAPGGVMPQTSSLTINGTEHQVSYKVPKFGEVDIPPNYLLGAQGVYGSRDHGWDPQLAKEVIINPEAGDIQVIWEKVFDEFSAATVEKLVLKKIWTKYLSYGTKSQQPRDYVTISFDPPIVKQVGERLTLNGVFKTTLNF